MIKVMFLASFGIGFVFTLLFSGEWLLSAIVGGVVSALFTGAYARAIVESERQLARKEARRSKCP